MAGETVLVIDDSATILKVVQLVLAKAGFDVIAAEDGESGLALARARTPSLILLDFVMPKMNGYQVCRSLAADPTLRQIPVVLMSAKGDQVGERFVKVMGIVDYITKPFSPEAITAVARHTITKYGGQTSDQTSDRSDDRTRMLTRSAAQLSDEDATFASDPEQVLERVRALIAPKLVRELADHLALALGEHEPDTLHEEPPWANHRALTDAVHQALDSALLSDLVSELEPSSMAGHTAALRGELRVIPLADVLQLLDAQKQSGVLTVERDGMVVEISFRQGRVALALAHGGPEEFLFGRFVVEDELLSQSDLDAFLASRSQSSQQGTQRIGTQLVKLGYLGETDLKATLAHQSRELIYETLRFRKGTFRFAHGRQLPDAAAEAMLGLDVESVLMEGFRRVDEWHLIEREVDDFDTIYLRNEDAVAKMGQKRLTREELTVLELVNGKNSVKEIVRASRMGSFEVSKMLYRLLSIKLVRRRVMPIAV